MFHFSLIRSFSRRSSRNPVLSDFPVVAVDNIVIGSTGCSLPGARLRTRLRSCLSLLGLLLVELLEQLLRAAHQLFPAGLEFIHLIIRQFVTTLCNRLLEGLQVRLNRGLIGRIQVLVGRVLHPEG